MLATAVTLAGCGTSTGNNEQQKSQTGTNSPGNASEQPSSSAEDKEVTIKLWIYPMIQGLNGDGTGNFDDWAQEYAKQFKELHPNVNVAIELLDWAGGTEKIDISVAGGSPPDLVYTINNFGGVTKFGKLGALEPIDPYLTEEDWNDYSDAVQGAMKYGESAYMWPWLKLVSAVAVNLDIFKERNATDLLPLNRELRDWTFDEYLKAAQATTYSTSGGDKPNVFGASVWGVGSSFYNYLNAASNGGAIMNNAFDKVTINTDEFKQGLQFTVDLATKYKVVPDGATGLTGTNMMELFLQGKIAMFPAGMDILDSVKTAPKPFNVGFVAPPHGEGQTTKAWNNVGGFIVFKQKDEAKKKLVMEFAKFITNSENSKVVKYSGTFPARNSSGDVYGDDPNYNYFSLLSQYGDSNFSRSYGLATPSDWEKAMQAMLLKQKTVDEVVGELESVIQTGLNKK